MKHVFRCQRCGNETALTVAAPAWYGAPTCEGCGARMTRVKSAEDEATELDRLFKLLNPGRSFA